MSASFNRAASFPATWWIIDWPMIQKGWIIGGFWLIFATAVGLYFFRKKEVK